MATLQEELLPLGPACLASTGTAVFGEQPHFHPKFGVLSRVQGLKVSQPFEHDHQPQIPKARTFQRWPRLTSRPSTRHLHGFLEGLPVFKAMSGSRDHRHLQTPVFMLPYAPCILSRL